MGLDYSHSPQVACLILLHRGLINRADYTVGVGERFPSFVGLGSSIEDPRIPMKDSLPVVAILQCYRLEGESLNLDRSRP